jgi:hypothetical protein
MTNATVGTVSQTGDGGIIRVTYKDSQSEYTVWPGVPVLAYVVGDTTLLKSGAAILTIARKQADGSLVTNRVTAEKDGVKPPMGYILALAQWNHTSGTWEEDCV